VDIFLWLFETDLRCRSMLGHDKRAQACPLNLPDRDEVMDGDRHKWEQISFGVSSLPMK
jgi:hypothetical protein